MYTRRFCPKVNILSILHSLFPQKGLLFHVASSLKPLSHVYSRPITSPFVDKLSNECLKSLPSCHKSNLIKKGTKSQPLESSQHDAIKIKKCLPDCHVHNKNSHSFLSWKQKSQYHIPILAIVCVHSTSNAEIFKMIVDRYN